MMFEEENATCNREFPADGTIIHYPDPSRVPDSPELIRSACAASGTPAAPMGLGCWECASDPLTRRHILSVPAELPSLARLARRRLPPTHSGAVGVISAATLRLFAALRSLGIRVVLISGARSSTLLQRLPFLPAADAYVCEVRAGAQGRRAGGDGAARRVLWRCCPASGCPAAPLQLPLFRCDWGAG